MFAISLITLKIKVFVVNVLFSCERWFVKMSHFYWKENINMIVKKFILSAKWMHLLERMSLKCKIKNSKRLSIFVFDGLVLMPLWSVDNFSNFSYDTLVAGTGSLVEDGDNLASSQHSSTICTTVCTSPNKLKLNINIVIILSTFFCCDVNIPCISAEISRLSLVHFTTELCLFLEVVHIYQDRHTHNTVVPAQIFLKKKQFGALCTHCTC